MTKYRRVYQGFNDLIAGLMRAQGFYTEMKETVSSLHKNVETFVNNRRSEGGQLLTKIEQSRNQGVNEEADQEQQRLKDLMARMSMEPSGSPVSTGSGNKRQNRPAPLSSASMGSAGHTSSAHPQYNPAASPPVTPRYPITGQQQYMNSPPQQPQQQPQQPYQPTNGYQPHHSMHFQPPAGPQQPRRDSYNYHPGQYNPVPVSPPAHQQYFSPPPGQMGYQNPYQHQGATPQPGQPYIPPGYVPPPPPPGPPPMQQGQQPGQDFGHGNPGFGQRMSQGSQGQQPHAQQGQGDPWAGLSGWR